MNRADNTQLLAIATNITCAVLSLADNAQLLMLLPAKLQRYAERDLKATTWSEQL
jgi:hypothetical protein